VRSYSLQLFLVDDPSVCRREPDDFDRRLIRGELPNKLATLPLPPDGRVGVSLDTQLQRAGFAPCARQMVAARIVRTSAPDERIGEGMAPPAGRGIARWAAFNNGSAWRARVLRTPTLAAGLGDGVAVPTGGAGTALQGDDDELAAVKAHAAVGRAGRPTPFDQEGVLFIPDGPECGPDPEPVATLRHVRLIVDVPQLPPLGHGGGDDLEWLPRERARVHVVWLIDESASMKDTWRALTAEMRRTWSALATDGAAHADGTHAGATRRHRTVHMASIAKYGLGVKPVCSGVAVAGDAPDLGGANAGGTRFEPALNWAHGEMARGAGHGCIPMLVLLTDGAPPPAEKDGAVRAVEQMESMWTVHRGQHGWAHVPFHAITIGVTRCGEVAALDGTLLKRMARPASRTPAAAHSTTAAPAPAAGPPTATAAGSYLYACDDASLARAFERVAMRVCELGTCVRHMRRQQPLDALLRRRGPEPGAPPIDDANGRRVPDELRSKGTYQRPPPPRLSPPGTHRAAVAQAEFAAGTQPTASELPLNGAEGETTNAGMRAFVHAASTAPQIVYTFTTPCWTRHEYELSFPLAPRQARVFGNEADAVNKHDAQPAEHAEGASDARAAAHVHRLRAGGAARPAPRLPLRDHGDGSSLAHGSSDASRFGRGAPWGRGARGADVPAEGGTWRVSVPLGPGDYVLRLSARTWTRWAAGGAMPSSLHDTECVCFAPAGWKPMEQVVERTRAPPATTSLSRQPSAHRKPPAMHTQPPPHRQPPKQPPAVPAQPPPHRQAPRRAPPVVPTKRASPPPPQAPSASNASMKSTGAAQSGSERMAEIEQQLAKMRTTLRRVARHV
jgi:hypothetical protein